MASGTTIQALKRLSFLPEREPSQNGTLIAGQEYDDVYITGGIIQGVNIVLTPEAVQELLNDSIGFSEYFETSPLAITAGSLTTVAHGLANTPKLFSVRLQCVTTSEGITAGQFVESSNADTTTGSTSTRGVQVGCDLTNLYIVVGSAGIPIINPSTGTATILTAANFRIVVGAWA